MALPYPLKLSIYGLAFIGFYGTWIRMVINGTLYLFLNHLHFDMDLPGLGASLVTRITGIYYPIDYYFNVWIIFFWNAVDGTHPTTSLIALYFAGQHFGTTACLYVDQYRNGKTGGLWSNPAAWPSSWLLIFQVTAYAFSAPFFLLASASTSIPWSLNSSPDSTAVSLIPVSLLIVYIIPLVLMGLPSPSITSNHFQQVAIAVWNIYPIFMYIVQPVLTRFSPFTLPRTKEGYRKAARITYGISTFISFSSHIAFLTILASAVLFPTIFESPYRLAFRPNELLKLPIDFTQVPSFGAGVLQFFQWDIAIGFASMVILGGMTYSKAKESLGGYVNPLGLGGLLALSTCLIGPGTTKVAIDWARDEMVVSGKKQEDRPKGR
ncbi:hypothetical protein B7494_g2488 [Chlorociboria aeruginascens]|nr:hypothetical protein B7494_g2488 [Chlorociboria aeruginascens]